MCDHSECEPAEFAQRSTCIAELAAALPKAQANIGAAKKDGKNPHFRSTFATLESVIDVLREPLYDNGLSYVQLPVHHPDGIGLTTMLIHSSGQWLGSTMVLPVDTQKGRTDVQAAGSTITYMRRYALLALLGIPTEDDDGNSSTSSTGDSRASQGTPRATNDPGTPATPKQIGMFHAITRALKLSDAQIAAGLESHGHTCEFSELTTKQASPVLDALKAKQDGGG